MILEVADIRIAPGRQAEFARAAHHGIQTVIAKSKGFRGYQVRSLPEVPRGNGIVNYLIASKKVGARTMHTGISKLPVGVTAPRHSHNAEEQVTVLEGTVKILLDDREQICRRFDSTFISAGVEHELVNVGDDTAYVLVVYGSPDVDRTFAATGEAVAVGSDGDRFVR